MAKISWGTAEIKLFCILFSFNQSAKYWTSFNCPLDAYRQHTDDKWLLHHQVIVFGCKEDAVVDLALKTYLNFFSSKNIFIQFLWNVSKHGPTFLFYLWQKYSRNIFLFHFCYVLKEMFRVEKHIHVGVRCAWG